MMLLNGALIPYPVAMLRVANVLARDEVALHESPAAGEDVVYFPGKAHPAGRRG